MVARQIRFDRLSETTMSVLLIPMILVSVASIFAAVKAAIAVVHALGL